MLELDHLFVCIPDEKNITALTDFGLNLTERREECIQGKELLTDMLKRHVRQQIRFPAPNAFCN